MRLQDLYLVETTVDDRNIISLATKLAAYLNSVDYNPYDIDDQIEISKISNVVKNPVHLLDDISVCVLSKTELIKRFKDVVTNLVSGFSALWDPDTLTIYIGGDIIKSPRLSKLLSHELRHALDFVKSEERAADSIRYSRPKKPEHRDGTRTEYLAEPIEINARYLEVVHNVAIGMAAASKNKKAGKDLIDAGLDLFWDFMKKKNISFLFPEKEKSKDYKRLVSRGYQFIENEATLLDSKKK